MGHTFIGSVRLRPNPLKMLFMRGFGSILAKETAMRSTDITDFDREKWAQEVEFRKRELLLEERKLDAAEKGNAFLKWASPLVLAILAATIAAFGNAGVALINGRAQRALEEANNASQLQLERFKADAAKILEVIKVGNPDVAAVNLDFLIKAGLIDDDSRRSALADFLHKRTPGQGPSLPSQQPTLTDATALISQFEQFSATPTVSGYASIIGFGHVLTPEEMLSRKIRIGAEDISIDAGITKEQGGILMDQDIAAISQEIDKQVTVSLTPQQKSALVSFIWNVGFKNFEKSTLLKILNEGRYEEVPAELARWSKIPGLATRRSAESDLWRKGTDEPK